jgi:mono/diheme cytochrome c family protein
MRSGLRAIWMAVSMAVVLAVCSLSTAAGQGNSVTGSDLFKSYCVACHGADARGTGPLAASLTKKPADLTALTGANGGTFPNEMVGRIIDGRNPVKGHGGGDMPVWGEALLRTQGGAGSEDAVKERIDALVDYLRTVQR